MTTKSIFKAKETGLIGYDSGESGRFFFVPLVDVAQGTELVFSDLLWSAGASFAYTATAPLAAGGLVQVVLGGPDERAALRAPTALVFVDSRVADLQTLLNAAQPGTQVWVLSAEFDGVQQIADLIEASGLHGLASIHLISHGSQGALQLGATTLDAGSLSAYAAQLADIGAALSPDGDLLLYGCDVASGTAGLQFIADLASATGADVAASTDATGASALGGDWALEASTGAIEPGATFDAQALASYPGVLANETFTVTQTSTLSIDVDGDGVVDPGDRLTTSVVITNNSSNTDATGVAFAETLVGMTLFNQTGGNGNDINVSPLAFNDSYSAVGNTLLEVGNATAQTGPQSSSAVKVTANDVEFFSDTYEISAFDAASAQGGTVTMVQSGAEMGSFTYISAAGYTGADSFTYTLRDKGLDGVANNADDLTSIATVTITVAGQVWYVDSAAAGGGTGTSLSPFNSFGATNLADNDGTPTGDVDDANDFIYVQGSPTGNLVLEAGQQLIGKGADLVVGVTTLATAGSNATLAASSGTALTLGSGNTVAGININNSAGGGIAGTGFGTFTVSASTISATGGTALDLTTGTVMGTGLTSTSSSGGTNNVNLNGVNGTVNLGSGALSGSTGTGFNVSGGAANIDYNGTISKTGNGNVVAVASHTGGTVQFDGTISSTVSGDGISLTSNAGATINFTNTLTLTTSASNTAGFSATGGGTVSATGTGSTISSGSGTGVNIANTTIAASDVTFQSVTAGGGSNAGIIVDTTGSAGGLHVTGSGTNVGATGGGVIATISGADITAVGGDGSLTISGTGGTGIFLRSTSDVQLNGLQLNGFSNFAILGSDVTGLTIDHTTINGANGDNSSTRDGAVWLQQLQGTATVANSTISGGYTHNMSLLNSSGTLTSLTISDSTISNNNATFGSNGLNIVNQGSAVSTVVVDNVSFLNNRASGLLADENGTTGSLNLTVTNSDFSNGNTAINLGHSLNGNGSYTFNLTGNTLVDHAHNAINIVTADETVSTAAIRGTIANNTIGDGSLDSGSRDAYGIAVEPRGDTNMVLSVTGNTVSNTDIEGILIWATDFATPDGVAGRLDLTVRNNTVNTPDDNSAFPFFAVYGMRIEARHDTIVRLDLAGNNSSSVGGLEEIRLRQRDTAEFHLERLTDGDGTPNELITTLATVEARILADNPSITTADAMAPAGGGFKELADGAVPNPLLAATGGVAADKSPFAAVTPPQAQEGADTPAADEPGLTPYIDEMVGPWPPVATQAGVLTQAMLDATVTQAIARWEATGLSAEQSAYLRAVTFTVADLAGQSLGSATPGQITIDTDAASVGWFVDATPADDTEFANTVSSTRLQANPNQAPAGHYDLLTAVMHELGHQLGLEDEYASGQRDNLEYGFLVTGERRLPQAGQADGATAGSVESEAFIGAPVSIGTLPFGKSVTVQWQATVNAQTNQLIVNPSNTGTVSATNGAGFDDANSNTVITTLDSLSLGNLIFNDLDQSGGFNAGDAGVNGVALTLFADNGTSGGVFDINDTQITTTTTAGGGFYAFNGLAPGEYIVRVDASNFGAGGALVNLQSSLAGQPDPDNNLENDDNGGGTQGLAHYSLPITLAYNTETTAGFWNDSNSTLDIGFANPPPVLTASGGTTAYTEGTALAIDGALTVTDDGANLSSATVSITGGFQTPQDLLVFTNQNGITGSYAGGTGILTLSGSASVANYQTALRSVTYNNSSDAPNTSSRTISYVANDGVSNSSIGTKTVSVTAVNDAPVLDLNGGVAGVNIAAAYTEADPATVLAPAAAVSDADSANFDGGSLAIAFTANGTIADQLAVLSVGNAAGQISVTGLNISYEGTVIGAISNLNDGTNGVTLLINLDADATPAAVQALVRSITYSNNSSTPSVAQRSLSFTLVDGDGTANSGLDTASASATVAITAINVAPVLAAGAVTAYTENAAATAISPALTVTDSDNPTLSTGTVSITANFALGQDVLSFTNVPATMGNIAGTYTPATGVMALSSAGDTATPAQWQAALRAVSYSNSSDNPSTLARTISYAVSDGTDASNTITSTVNVAAVNDAPTLSTTVGTTAFTEGNNVTSTPVVVDSALTLADLDDINLESATVSITTGFQTAEDSLVFVDQLGITGIYTAATGVLALTGSSSVLNYQTALRSITYTNSSEAPNTATRTISFMVNDGSADSTAGTRNVSVAAVNDTPTLSSMAAVVDTVNEDIQATITFAEIAAQANEADADGTVSSFIVKAVSTGTLLIGATAGSATPWALTTNDVVNASLNAYWTPALDANGTLNAFTVVAKDNVGTESATPVQVQLTVTAVNDAPTLTTTVGTSAFTEGNNVTSTPVVVDSGLTLADVDDANLEVATVSITTGFQTAEDVLVFVDQLGITGIYTAATGVLVLTGSASVANYQTALRSITYTNSSQIPLNGDRTISFVVNDGSVDSLGSTKTVSVTAVNDTPTLTSMAAVVDTVNEDIQVAISFAEIAAQGNEADLDSAELAFVVKAVSTGTLLIGTSAGSATAWAAGTNDVVDAFSSAFWTPALNANGTLNAFTVVARDNLGAESASPVQVQVDVTAVNDAPVATASVGSTTFTEGSNVASTPVVVDATLTLADVDDTNLESATISITTGFQTAQDSLVFVDQLGITGIYTPATGVLALTGSASVADYQTALRSITYTNSSDTPNTANRTISFSVNDGALPSTATTKTVTVTAANDSPVLADTVLTLTVAEDPGAPSGAVGSLVSNFTGGISDPDGTPPKGLAIIASDEVNGTWHYSLDGGSNWLAVGAVGATSALLLADNANTRLFFAPNADYNGSVPAGLTVKAWDQSSGSAGSKVDTSLTSAFSAASDTVALTVTPVNDAPVLANGTTLAYTENGPAAAINTAITLGDVDNATLASATVSITDNFAGLQDLLSFTNVPATMGDITGNYASGTGVMTLTSAGATATLAQWQTALRAVQYSNSSDNPSTAARTISYAVNDGTDGSNTVTSTVNVTAVNDAPSATASGGVTAFTEGNNTPSTPVVVDSAISLSDVDDTHFEGATVSISGNFQSGQDLLLFTNQNGISGSYAAGTGVLTLTGSASVLNYQAALRSITYSNSSDTPNTADRTVSFVANDGSDSSTAVTKTVSVAAVNDSPVATASVGITEFIVGGSIVTTPVAVDGALSLSDLDDIDLEGATVSITGNFQNGQDLLLFTNQNGIIGSYDAGLGVLTLNGSASVANYQAALQSVSYSNSLPFPNTLDRTISFVVTDGSDNSDAGTKTVNVIILNVAPELNTSASPSLPAVPENAANPAGISIAGLVEDGSISDLDGAVEAIAITALNTSLGAWQYSVDGGASWLTINADLLNSETNELALLLGPTAKIRLLPFGEQSGSLADALTFRAWDQFTGSQGQYVTITATGGNTAFSTASDTASITVTAVNDAPSFAPFVGTGKLLVPVGAFDDVGDSLSLQPDGKLVLAGYSRDGSVYDFALIRLNTDGSLDTGFDGDGKLVVSVGASDDLGYSLSLQPDGKLVLAGNSWNGSNHDYALIRLNTDGSLDTSFDGDGKLLVQVGASTDQGYSLSLQPDGKLVLAGSSWNGSNHDYALIRLNTDGSLDTSFDGDGKLIVPVGASTDQSLSLSLQPDGKLVLAGYSDNGSNNDYSLIRLNADGSLDTSFDGDGKLLVPVGTFDDVGYSLSLQPDGKLVLAGYSYNGNNDYALIRLNTDGSLDTSFDGDGKLLVPVGASDDFGQSLSLQPDGKLVLAGSSWNGSNFDYSVIRLNTDGSLDTSFDGDGKLLVPVGASNDQGYSLILQPDGKLVLAGDSSNGSNHDFSLIRLNADGSLDRSFSGAAANTLGGALAYTENGAPIALDNAVAIFDTELAALNGGVGNYAGASVTLARQGGANAQDLFSALGNLVLSGGNAVLAGVSIGSYSNIGGQLVISFNGNASQVRVNEALSSLAYANSSDTPPASVQVGWTFNDGNGGAQGVGGMATAMGSTTVNITAVNDAPVATATAGITAFTEGNNIASTPVAVDSALTLGDVDDTHLESATVSISGNFQAGQDLLLFNNQNGISGSYAAGTGVLTLTGSASVVSYQAALQTVAYSNSSDTPNTGSRTVSYVVNDGSDNSAPVTKTVSVTAVNDSPTATNLWAPEGYTEDAPLHLARIVVNDPDSSTVTVTLTLSNPAAGVLSPGYGPGSSVWSTTGSVTEVNNMLAGATFTPAPDFTGSFKVLTSLSDGTVLITGEKDFTNAALNDAPTASNLSAPESYTEDSTLNLTDIVVTDPDNSTVTATLTLSNPAAGALSTGTAGATSASFVAGVWSATGALAEVNSLLASVAFTPAAHFNSTFSITTSVSDGMASVSGSKAFTGAAVNDAPLTVADSASLSEGATVSTLTGGATSVLANDSDAEGNTLTAVLVSGPTNGSLTLNANGTFNYTHNGGESTSDSFSYRANDGTSNGNVVNVPLTISAVNDAPLTVADSASLSEGGTVSTLTGGATSVLTNDSDAEGNTLTAVLVSGPANGSLTLNPNGTFSYTHNGGESTSDSFSYRTNDGTSNGNTVTVPISISAVNDAPVTVADSASLSEGGTVSVLTGGATSVLTNDSDAEGNTLTAVLVSGPTNGVLTLNPNGTFSYTHNGGESTSDSFSYRSNDGTSNGNTVTVPISINAVNDAPVLTGVPATAQAVNVGPALALADFTVADTDSASLTLSLTASNGTLHGLSDAAPATPGIQLTGSAASINAAVAGATFTAAGPGAASIALSVSDGLASASASYPFNASVPNQNINGTPEPDTLVGGAGNDTFTGLASDDAITGAGGNDSIDGGSGKDTIYFTGTRASHHLSKVGNTVVVADTIANRDGTDTLTNTETLRFSDLTVDLTMGAKSLSISAANLKTLEEIYVGFFNRVPDAAGMAYWIGEIASGVTLTQVANRAYDAGVQYSELTGYTADMTTDAFITKIYANVFGRSGATAPNADEVAYWANWLNQPGQTKGSMVLQMLSDVHTHFETSVQWGWVASLLNNKAAVANYYAIEQGLGFVDAASNITFGMELAALITPTDTTAAIALIGVDEFSTLG